MIVHKPKGPQRKKTIKEVTNVVAAVSRRCRVQQSFVLLRLCGYNAALEALPQDSQLFWLTERTRLFTKLFTTTFVHVRCSMLELNTGKAGQTLGA